MTTTTHDHDNGPTDEYLDIVVIGAGLSGISAGCRLQAALPEKSFVILERRERIGGTWDLFKYPGIRSDTELVSYGFPFAPWPNDNLIGTGDEIASYIRTTAATHGLDDYIRTNHSVVAAEWSSKERTWALTVSTGVEQRETVTIHARYLMWASGYYDHASGMAAAIPGIESFSGAVVHPQFWPEELDYKGKRVVVIGSGATAVTLLPALVDSGAGHVTMLQRSPSYVLAIPSTAPEDAVLRRYLPVWLSSRLIRWKHLVPPRLVVEFCRLFPGLARAGLLKLTAGLLPAHIPRAPHFEPRYNPGEQRICMTPNGAFFTALQDAEKASVVTDTIRTVTARGIELDSGSRLDADVIVTATGLKLQLFGGARIVVDGEEVALHEKYAWNGTMLQDVPNLSVLIGYTNFAWTPGVDVMGRLAVRLIQMMEERGATMVTPRVDEGRKLTPMPLLNITSTYAKVAAHYMPISGSWGPWKGRAGYFEDLWKLKFGDLSQGLVFE